AYLQAGTGLLVASAGALLCLLLGFGITLWTSVLNAEMRDIRYVSRYVLEVGLYVTPVVYPLTRLPPWLRTLSYVNPMTAPAEMIKHGMLGAGTVQAAAVVWSVVAVILALGSGLYFFSR